MRILWHKSLKETFRFFSFAEKIDDEKQLWYSLKAMEAMEMDSIVDCYTDSEMEQFGHDVSDTSQIETHCDWD